MRMRYVEQQDRLPAIYIIAFPLCITALQSENEKSEDEFDTRETDTEEPSEASGMQACPA
jgi:hypothetical protein